MQVEIKNRWSGAVLFSCELSAEFDAASWRMRLGAAVRLAYSSGAVLRDAVLRDADLRDADLRDAVLRDADLRGADLSGADLSGAVLSDADLSGADLRDADLRDAVLRDADLRGADLSGAVLSGADLSDADLSGVPKIPNIHQRVYEAASQEGALEMGCWHTCDTTHCRAGWVVTLAGDAGKAIEFCLGTGTAAALIYMASDPHLERIPDFYASNDDALADMRRLSEQEAAR